VKKWPRNQGNQFRSRRKEKTRASTLRKVLEVRPNVHMTQKDRNTSEGARGGGKRQCQILQKNRGERGREKGEAPEEKSHVVGKGERSGKVTALLCKNYQTSGT